MLGLIVLLKDTYLKTVSTSSRFSCIFLYFLYIQQFKPSRRWWMILLIWFLSIFFFGHQICISFNTNKLIVDLFTTPDSVHCSSIVYVCCSMVESSQIYKYFNERFNSSQPKFSWKYLSLQVSVCYYFSFNKLLLMQDNIKYRAVMDIMNMIVKQCTILSYLF